jgi:uncharacterized membrane protein
MNADTCAVLASVFPLILITTVLEARAVHFNLRSRRLFRWSTYAGMSTSLIGIGIAVIGVAVGGYDQQGSIMIWLLFGVAILALAISVVGIAATLENEDDEKLAKRAKKAKRTRRAN